VHRLALHQFERRKVFELLSRFVLVGDEQREQLVMMTLQRRFRRQHLLQLLFHHRQHHIIITISIIILLGTDLAGKFKLFVQMKRSLHIVRHGHAECGAATLRIAPLRVGGGFRIGQIWGKSEISSVFVRHQTLQLFPRRFHNLPHCMNSLKEKRKKKEKKSKEMKTKTKLQCNDYVGCVSRHETLLMLEDFFFFFFLLFHFFTR
jgi:hypothetical protein